MPPSLLVEYSGPWEIQGAGGGAIPVPVLTNEASKNREGQRVSAMSLVTYCLEVPNIVVQIYPLFGMEAYVLGTLEVQVPSTPSLPSNQEDPKLL